MGKMEKIKTIKIDEVEYIKKEDAEKLMNKTPSFKPNYALADPCHVIAITSCKIGEGYSLVVMDLTLLQRAINVFKQLKLDEVTLAIKNNFPLIIGAIDYIKKDTINGVVIAPRIKDEKERKKYKRRLKNE